MNPSDSGHSSEQCVRLTPLAQPVVASGTVPGSKSYTIRALILAALTPKREQQPIKIMNPLVSDDSQAVLNCLKTLGIQISEHEAGQDRWLEVHNTVTDIQAEDYELNADLSAATLRFLLALSAVIPGRQTLLGKEGLNKRPVRDLVDSLRAIGTDIEYLERDGYPPVRINSNRLDGTVFKVSGATSSQYISALMMIAPLLQAQNPEHAVTVALTDDPVSKPYLDMTISIMRDFGVAVENHGYQQFIIPGGQAYNAHAYVVEPDASSMAYFLAIAALTGSSITVRHLNQNSAQADMRFAQILEAMGNRLTWRNDELTVTGLGLKPLLVNMEDCPDQAQTLAVLAAFVPGVTRIEGLQSLRVKETDRIASTAQELAKMGIRTESEPDTLVIYGGNPQPARIATYGDHRMAMAFAVAGSKLDGLEIEDPAVVNKTYPGFWEDLRQLGVGVDFMSTTAQSGPGVNSNRAVSSTGSKQNVVLIGFMGAGKSAVSQLLAQALGLNCVEMDEHIVKRSGRASVAEIFDLDGESHFRILEATIAEELESVSGSVISTGGGIVMSDAAMRALGQTGTVVFLQTELQTILSRIGEDDERPLLRDKTQFEALYTLRQPLYAQAAHLQISTDDKSPMQVVEAIQQALAAKAIEQVCTV